MKKTASAVFFILQFAVSKKKALPFDGQRTKATLIANTTGIKEVHRTRKCCFAHLLACGNCLQRGCVRMPKKNNICTDLCRVRDKRPKASLNAPFMTVAKKDGMPFKI